MIDAVLSELDSRVVDIAARHPSMEKALLKQPDIAIGLGLFEAMHILDAGRNRRNGDAATLLDEVIG